MTNATNKNIHYTHIEETRILNAVLDGILVYKRPDTDLYRVVVREYDLTWDCAVRWIELFWNSNTGQHWLGDSYSDNKSIGDEVYLTWLSAPFALRKLALDLRLAAIP